MPLLYLRHPQNNPELSHACRILMSLVNPQRHGEWSLRRQVVAW